MSDGKIAVVVKVIDEFKIAINRGVKDGIREGQRFLVYGLLDEIADPETGEPLGRLEVVRGKGEVIHVQDRLATLRCIEKRRIPKITRKIHDPFRITMSSHVEEIEPETWKDMPFEDPKIGDAVKPI